MADWKALESDYYRITSEVQAIRQDLKDYARKTQQEIKQLEQQHLSEIQKIEQEIEETWLSISQTSQT